MRSKSTESAPDWLRVSAWTQHYSLVGHMLSYLSSLMVVGKIDLRVSSRRLRGYEWSVREKKLDTRVMCLSRGLSTGFIIILNDKECIEKLLCVLKVGLTYLAEVLRASW